MGKLKVYSVNDVDNNIVRMVALFSKDFLLTAIEAL